MAQENALLQRYQYEIRYDKRGSNLPRHAKEVKHVSSKIIQKSTSPKSH